MRIYYKCGFCKYEFYFYSFPGDYNSDSPSSMIVIYSLGGVVNNNKRKGNNKIKKRLLYPDSNLVIGVYTVTCFLSEEERSSFIILNEDEIEIMLETYKIWSNNEYYSAGAFTRVFWI